jgi:hypothetical protein
MLYDKLDVSGLFWSIEERYSPRDDVSVAEYALDP